MFTIHVHVNVSHLKRKRSHMTFGLPLMQAALAQRNDELMNAREQKANLVAENAHLQQRWQESQNDSRMALDNLSARRQSFQARDEANSVGLKEQLDEFEARLREVREASEMQLEARVIER